MEEDIIQWQQTKIQKVWQENLALVHPPHEMDGAQPKDYDLGKKQDQQGNKNQDIQQQVRASQATYADMLAKLS